MNQSLPAAPVSGMRFRCRWAHRVRAVKLAGTGRQLSCHALCHQVVRVPAITCTVSCWTSGAWRWVPLALAAHLGSRIPLPPCPGVLTCRPQHKKKLLPALGTVQWGLWRMLAACRHCFCGTAGCPARLPAGARMCSQGVVVWAGGQPLGHCGMRGWLGRRHCHPLASSLPDWADLNRHHLLRLRGGAVALRSHINGQVVVIQAGSCGRQQRVAQGLCDTSRLQGQQGTPPVTAAAAAALFVHMWTCLTVCCGGNVEARVRRLVHPAASGTSTGAQQQC